MTTLSVAPVMAAMISSVDTSPTSKTPLLRPRRSTATRSATACTSAMLWLIMITPCPRSRSRSTRLSTSAVWATPSAAVGSSRMMIFGSPSSDRAIATVWRWPPDSEATGMRTVGIFAESCAQQLPRPDLHRHLVEPQPAELLAEEQVLDDVEVLAQGEVLEHGGDPELRGRRPGRDGHLLASEGDGAGVGRVHAGEHLDQRRLAGAVVADDGDHLARRRRRGRCR